MSNPATPSQKFTLYKDNTGAFSFTLLSGESPIDIVNEYLTLRVVFYARTGGIETGEFLFDYDLADLTLTNTNTVSTTITKERVNQLFGKGLNFVQLVVTTATRTETLYVNQVQVFNDINGAELSNASTLDVDGDFNVTVNVTTLEVPLLIRQFYDYLIFKEGTTYYAQNSVGRVEFSDANFADVVQYAHDNIVVKPTDREPGLAGGESGGIIAISGADNTIVGVENGDDFRYYINKTIEIRKRIIVQGFGNPRANPIIYLEDGADCDMFKVINEGGVNTNRLAIVQFYKLRLAGNKANQTIPTSGIVFAGGAELKCHDMECTSFKGYGIDYNSIGGNSGAFQGYNSVSNCFIVVCDLGGIHLSNNTNGGFGLTDITITENVFLNLGNAIVIDNEGSDEPISETGAIITNNIFSFDKIVVNGISGNFLFANNVFNSSNGTTAVGIEFVNRATESNANSIITGNIFGKITTPITVGENWNDILITNNQSTNSPVATLSGVGNDNVRIYHDDVFNTLQKAPNFEATESFILSSPDASRWDIEIGNDGVLTTTKIV